MTVPDHYTRQSALDTTQSFIVQAPAGSGKTELLVQRFLALLAKAEHAPEEIIAITFTRKAAAEMRQRILEALDKAQGAPPSESHAKKTWELGCAALQRDKLLKWNLLENPNRLRVQTIDALCASIAHQAPLLSGLGVSNEPLTRDADQYYLAAARRLLGALEEESPLSAHLACLLLHLDNRIETVEALLMRMLARRDQWLPHLILHGKSLNVGAFREKLEAGLSHAVVDILTHCDQALPDMLRDELLMLMRFSAEHLPNSKQTGDIKNLLEFPQAIPAHREIWLFLAQILLTKEGTWRRRVDKSIGFPAEEKVVKQRLQLLINGLNQNDRLRQHLADLMNAPPLIYTESQWQIIAALSELLPLLVAELKVLFKENNVADFSEIAMAANAALGDLDAPTDLTFILDTQIRHLLIDEFQDTSIAQFHLLEKLTAGWQPHDGRSLFLVGDPMQSIYRFREAEVGLFLKAQQEGLGSIKLNPLVLSANFRSTPELIKWINDQFTTIFPTESDMSLGAIPFSPCEAVKLSDDSSGVFLEVNSSGNDASSVAKIIDIIKQAQSASTQETIAILVRSRGHLKAIVPELKKANLQFTAVEIDPLYKQSIVQDLLSLTGALLHVGDRLSWLSVLRAPWCGLTLHDLYVISQKQPKKPLWEALSTFAAIKELSEDGQKRLATVVPVLKKSLTERGRLSFRAWIEETWRALNGAACVTDNAALTNAEAYFKLLDVFDQAGEIPDREKLQQTIQTEYVSPPSSAECRLHVMTIHKAKGLEFDTVIVPCLELKNRSDDDQLLLWLDRPRAQNTNDLILAPIKAKHQKSDAMYAWVRDIEKTKAHHELTRLLYVAVTRAKKKLYLMSTLYPEQGIFKKPETGSFLALLWHSFESIVEKKLLDQPVLAEPSITTPVFLKRLKTREYKNETVVEAPPGITNDAGFKLEDQTARHIGTIMHQILEQVSREGLAVWTKQRIEQEKTRWKMWLVQIGVPQQALTTSLMRVCVAIENTLNDPRGQWILTAHTDHHSEYALTAVIDGVPIHTTMDRTFIDIDVRWIIDYKTGQPADDQDRESFLEAAQTTHREQLEKYAAIMRRCEDRPIRLGVYFPSFGGWCEWAFHR
jgi:ATP-dependent helicase/nuclease subunit A